MISAVHPPCPIAARALRHRPPPTAPPRPLDRPPWGGEAGTHRCLRVDVRARRHQRPDNVQVTVLRSDVQRRGSGLPDRRARPASPPAPDRPPRPASA